MNVFLTLAILISILSCSSTSPKVPATSRTVAEEKAEEAEEFLEQLEGSGLSRNAYDLMMGQVLAIGYKRQYVAIVDYTISSRLPRFFLIDIKNQKLRTFHVSHGNGSGDDQTECVSDIVDSHQSSLGFATTVTKVGGLWQPALGLRPISPFNCDKNCKHMSNSNIQNRDIIIHSAEYSTQAFFDLYGFWGRSQGCLALTPNAVRSVISSLGVGSLVLTYHDELWNISQQEPRKEHCTATAGHKFNPPTPWEYQEGIMGVGKFQKVKHKYKK